MTKSRTINYLISLLFAVYYLICIRNSYLQIVTFKNGWYLGEWIINYQDGGFKRRGLFGSFFIFVNEMTAIPLEYIVFSFVFLIYTTFFHLLFTLFWKKKNRLNILFTVLTIIAGSEKTAEDTRSKDAVAILIIIFNSLWSTMVLHLGFVSFPVIDLFLKKLFYFLYFKLKILYNNKNIIPSGKIMERCIFQSVCHRICYRNPLKFLVL